MSALVPNASGKRGLINTTMFTSSLSSSPLPKVAQWTTSDTLTAMCTLASVALSKTLLFLDSMFSAFDLCERFSLTFFVDTFPFTLLSIDRQQKCL